MYRSARRDIGRTPNAMTQLMLSQDEPVNMATDSRVDPRGFAQCGPRRRRVPGFRTDAGP